MLMSSRDLQETSVVCPIASRTSSRFSGDKRDSLDVCIDRFVQPAESDLVADLGRQKVRDALCCSRAHCIAALLKGLDQTQSSQDEW